MSSLFPAGTYYRIPSLTNPASTLGRLNGSTGQTTPMPPVGWDMCVDRSFYIYQEPTQMVLVFASGQTRRVRFQGIDQVVRPSLSPDCRFVVVQASASEVPPQTPDLNIYKIDLTTGATERIGNLPVNEESPRYFPTGNRIDPRRRPRSYRDRRAGYEISRSWQNCGYGAERAAQADERRLPALPELRDRPGVRGGR